MPRSWGTWYLLIPYLFWLEIGLRTTCCVRKKKKSLPIYSQRTILSVIRVVSVFNVIRCFSVVCFFVRSCVKGRHLVILSATVIQIFLIVSGPITRSHSRANSSFGESVDHTSVGTTEPTELMGKLSELLNAIEKSTRTNQQSQEQFAESTEKGIRSQTDFLTFQEQHQTQLATLLKQNSLQVGPALKSTPFFGKPTEDLAAFLSHFERYSNFCGWDSKQCLRALPLYLQGNAGSWYASLNTSFDSYDDLTKALKEQFSNPASIWLLHQQLSARKQNETEP